MEVIYGLSLLLLLVSSIVPATLATPQRNHTAMQTYIVHVNRNPTVTNSQDRERWHESFLPAAAVTTSASPRRLLYSYGAVASAFAARLTEAELADMATKDSFLTATPDRLVPLHTTHSPAFLRLSSNDASGFWRRSGFGKGVIIGMIDTGITPTHPSFSGRGMPPPPSKWNGTCEFKRSECNNKLIGARSFVKGSNAMASESAQPPPSQGPYDDEGHGTHTASTAAGTFVRGANVNGEAAGTAVGIAPSAHLAAYKVCGPEGRCALSDILAGIDAAVDDGVDVLSISIGGGSVPFHEDSLAIAALGAVEKGVFVTCSAGNGGPSLATTANEAPWILTVGASSIDRAIRATVKLDNGAVCNGESLSQPKSFPSRPLPLVYLAACTNGSLDGIDVRGKAVVCDSRSARGSVVKDAGGAAMIIANGETEASSIMISEDDVLPASTVAYEDGLAIKFYISSDSAPTAKFRFEGTVTGVTPAPVMAWFSSRGPNQADPRVLKPDITGPGLNILAAWPGPEAFNMISGTSMSAPHLSGIAALLKSSHPDWSPAAIKSAIMTTAGNTANDGEIIRDEAMRPATSFHYGAGHVDPTKATNPGLVYDINPDVYVSYLCGLGYSDGQVTTVARRRIKCSAVKSVSGSELNYPSIAVPLGADNGYRAEVTRTVTNVGAPVSAYVAQFASPPGVKMVVSPERMSFSESGEEATFSVSFASSSSNSRIGTYVESQLTWISSDETISVRSPVVIGLMKP